MTASQRPRGSTGSLALALAARTGRTVATKVAHHGALRTLRPRYDDDSGWATWTILNPGGGYLAGDTYDLTLTLAAGARASVIGQSATKIYRCDGSSEVIQTASVRLGPEAVLDWRAEPIIAYAGARYRQHTVITRDPGATVLLGEVVTPGWASDGTAFSWTRIHVLTEICRPDGTLEVLDNLVIDPLEDDPSDDALAAGFSHLGSLVILDSRIGPALRTELDALLEAAATGIRHGIGLTPGPGLVLRVLADSSEQVQAALDLVADEVLCRWFGRQRLQRHQW